MSVDFNGHTEQYVLNGDRAHEFRLPRNRAVLPKKVSAALGKVAAARKAEADLNAGDYHGRRAANEQLREAVGQLYDEGSASSYKTEHLDAYVVAKARFERLLGEAERALQDLADRAQCLENPQGIGFPPDIRSVSVNIRQLHSVAAGLEQLPKIPELS
ncbi:hypothetical protein [Streptomyces sp. NPDC058108]|uniref:hypothetical protein n=1 Tax=Streptomyces sp. NPDC058108 TaxID=3346344 RepID=UPI0036E27FDD